MISNKIRLSYSALNTLHTCERMFQLDRLLVTDREKEDFPSTVLGRAYGTAVQSYLLHQDQDKALFDGYLAYWPILEEEKRNEEVFCSLFMTTVPQLDLILQDYEVATFRDKKAVELSFCLHINADFYYVGYIDVVLKNIYTDRYAVLEIKHTTAQLLDLSPMYQNSGQALGYSIVLDEIVGEDQGEYDLLYVVGQVGKNPFNSKAQSFTFPKTLLDRFNWFISLGMDTEHLSSMIDNNVFPMRGSNCLQYMRPCKHFGTCQLHALDVWKEREDDLIEYDFTYNLDDLITNHIGRL